MENPELVDSQIMGLISLENVAHILYLVLVQVFILIDDLILLLLIL